jgi:alcohol dehydrogenase class IV
MKAFNTASLPRLILKEAAFRELPGLVAEAGFRDIGVVHGRSVYAAHGEDFRRSLRSLGIPFREAEVRGEPSPAMVDSIVSAWSDHVPELIVAVGGGSVLDAGKAVCAMLAEGGGVSVREYLEGVGSREPSGRSLPLYAVPSTAGTGSEATKNAVISELGSFKKSLRHDNFVPVLACIDPLLAAGAPRQVSAAAGLDAITQLLEAYLSTGANEFTDALALSGLSAAGRAFPRILREPGDLDARLSMGYAAYLSGVVLANAGLGVVHGAASPLGAARDIPHGVVCGLLLPGSVRHIEDYAARSGDSLLQQKIDRACRALGSGERRASEFLEGLLAESGLPGLASYGFDSGELSRLAADTGLKNSPVSFSENEIAGLFLERL